MKSVFYMQLLLMTIFMILPLNSLSTGDCLYISIERSTSPTTDPGEYRMTVEQQVSNRVDGTTFPVSIDFGMCLIPMLYRLHEIREIRRTCPAAERDSKQLQLEVMQTAWIRSFSELIRKIGQIRPVVRLAFWCYSIADAPLIGGLLNPFPLTLERLKISYMAPLAG